MSTQEQFLAIRHQRLELQRQADLLEQQEKALGEQLINDMVLSGTDQYLVGSVGIKLVVTQEPQVESWPDLIDYISRTNSFDIFQKRVTPSAIKTRWAEHDVPGVTSVTKRVLKVSA